MATTHSSRRSRKLRRRFSSGTLGASTTALHSIFAPISRDGERKASLSPPPSSYAEHPSHRLYADSGTEEESPFQAHSNDIDRILSDSRLFYKQPRLTAYASLPPTPILASRPYSPPTPVTPISAIFKTEDEILLPTQAPPFSLWDYLREELLATDFDSHQELKWERVSNFLSIPVAMEKVRFFEPL